MISRNVFPPPLTHATTGNIDADVALAMLQRGQGFQDKYVLATAMSAGAEALLPLLDEAALDVGTTDWDDTFRESLGLKERSGLVKRYTACAAANKGRKAYRAFLVNAIATCATGRARLLGIASSSAFAVDARALAASAIAKKDTPRETLQALAELLDPANWDAVDGALADLSRLGARAFFQLGPRVAFDRLSPLLGVACVGTEPGARRANAILSAAIRHANQNRSASESGLDTRWIEVVLPLVGHHDLRHRALSLLEMLPADERVIAPILQSLEPAREIRALNDRVLRVLSRVADFRVVPYLVAALRGRTTFYQHALDGLRRADDPATAHVVREWLARGRDKKGAREKLCAEVIEHLERNGATPPPAGRLLEPIPWPTERPVLVFEETQARPSSERPPPIEEQKREIDDLFAEAGLAEWMSVIPRAAVRIYPTRVQEHTLALGASKIGGHPDLPEHTPWPQATDGAPMTFLAQLDLTELGTHLSARELPLFPRSGWLSFFAATHLEVRALFTASAEPIVRRDVPEDDVGVVYQACSVEMCAALKLPSPRHCAVTTRLEKDALARYADSIHVYWRPAYQVLGYRDHEYDASPAGASLLFQCPSGDQPGMGFGDLDTLCFFIKDEDLAKGDFSAVFPVMGDGFIGSKSATKAGV